MNSTRRWILVSTGEDTPALERMEQSFAPFFASMESFEILRLGRVDSLLAAYWNTARLVKDDHAVFLFAHQDVEAVLPPGATLPEPLLASLTNQAPWLAQAFRQPEAWLALADKLLDRPDTGFLGVAGSCSLEPGVAWWNSPNLSGAVIHHKKDGSESLNAYGACGRVAVLDGLFLVAPGRLFRELGRPRAGGPSFHFYDMEWTLRAHLAGKRNWTLPLLLMHRSGGAGIDCDDWRHDAEVFCKRFSARLPVAVPHEPLPDWT